MRSAVLLIVVALFGIRVMTYAHRNPPALGTVASLAASTQLQADHALPAKRLARHDESSLLKNSLKPISEITPVAIRFVTFAPDRCLAPDSAPALTPSRPPAV